MIAWMPVHKESPEELRDVLIHTKRGRIYIAHLWKSVSHTPPPEFRLWWRLNYNNRDLRFDDVTHWAFLTWP